MVVSLERMRWTHPATQQGFFPDLTTVSVTSLDTVIKYSTNKSLFPFFFSPEPHGGSGAPAPTGGPLTAIHAL